MLAKQEVATCLYFCGLMLVIITLHVAEETPEVPAYACLAHHFWFMKGLCCSDGMPGRSPHAQERIWQRT